MDEVVFKIIVTPLDDWDRAKVTIDATDLDGALDRDAFGYWMCACEFFLNVVATKSGLEYDEAIAKLAEGSKTYSDGALRLIKGGEAAG